MGHPLNVVNKTNKLANSNCKRPICPEQFTPNVPILGKKVPEGLKFSPSVTFLR